MADDGTVGDIHAASRLLRPGHGCLHCNGLISPTQLAVDLQPETVREAARYIAEVAAPSVITLNMLAAADAMNTLLPVTVGLLDPTPTSRSTIPTPFYTDHAAAPPSNSATGRRWRAAPARRMEHSRKARRAAGPPNSGRWRMAGSNQADVQRGPLLAFGPR